VDVSEVHADRRRLVEDQRRGASSGRVVDEDGDQPVRIEREICLRLVRRMRAIDELERERRADLLEDDVRDEARVAGVVVERRHRMRQGAGSR
jgi:hypothetical protein